MSKLTFEPLPLVSSSPCPLRASQVNKVELGRQTLLNWGAATFFCCKSASLHCWVTANLPSLFWKVCVHREALAFMVYLGLVPSGLGSSWTKAFSLLFYYVWLFIIADQAETNDCEPLCLLVWVPATMTTMVWSIFFPYVQYHLLLRTIRYKIHIV